MPNGLKPQFGIGSTKPKIMVITQNVDFENALIDIPITEDENIYFYNLFTKYNLCNDVYITPILKCGKFVGNSKNSKKCVNWINEEIKILNPKVVLLMGKVDKVSNLIQHEHKITFNLTGSQLFRASKEKTQQFENIIRGVINWLDTH